ncbi:MAG: hypothetical protein ORO02_00370 [Bacteroidia bacterium]|jgi:hypothetical protein|nr:hypothetical protein [Bacteroidia bacterium]
MKTLKNSLMLVVLLAGLNNHVSAQYNDNDNDNDTEVKVDKGKGKDDGDQSKRLEVIQKSLEKKKGILLGDTVYYMGKPNCLFITEKKFLGSLVQGTCKALNGKEAFWINLKTNEYLPNNDPNKRFFEIVFVASNAKINYMGSQNALIRDIAKFNLFEDGVYNTNSERKFCTMTNSTTINTGVVVYQNSTPMNPNNPYGQVERSKNGMIQAQGNQIIQDFKVIGTFNQFKQATNGTIQNEITFYLPNGTMIARCTAYGATSHDFTVITTLDNRNAQINTGMITEAQDLARYLVNNGYM